MTNQTPAPRRQAHSTRRQISLRLVQVRLDKDKYCHRDDNDLEPDKLSGLSTSLVQEGPQTPMVVVATKAEIECEGEQLPVYLLVSGHRRHAALKEAVRQNLDPERIFESMQIDATEVVQGSDQTDPDFEIDLLVASVTDNEQRKNLTSDQRLVVIAKFIERRISAQRGAAALGISDSQYARDVRLVRDPVMYAWVKAGKLTATLASKLIEAAKAHGEKYDLHTEVGRMLLSAEKRRDTEVAKKAKVNKKASSLVKDYIPSRFASHWVDQIEKARPLDEDVSLKFGIAVDEENDELTITGVQSSLKALRVEDYSLILTQLDEAKRALRKPLQKALALAKLEQSDDSDLEGEIERILAERREQQARQREAESGRPASDFGVVAEPVTTDVSDLLPGADDEFDGDLDA